jgi:signal transduction histidine kinase
MSSNDKLDLLRDDLEQIAARLADGHRLLVLGEMSATLAHDLMNQLTVVLSCASHLRLANGAGVMDGEAREELMVAAQQAVALCREVLDLARPARDVAVTFDVNATVTKLTAFLTKVHLPGAGRIELELQLSADPLWTAADEALIANALLNVALNSRDAMPSHGRLTIRTELEAVAGGSARVRVELADTGTGIPPDLLERVFQPFFTTKPNGTGLGLASVRRAVERYGGAVEISSAVGKGTTVRILLPSAPPPAR